MTSPWPILMTPMKTTPSMMSMRRATSLCLQADRGQKVSIICKEIFVLTITITGHLGVDTQSFQDPSELLQFVQKDEQDQKYHCTLCGKFSHKWSSCTRNHVESKHFPTTFRYPCNECEMIFNTKTTFNLHRSKMHTAKNK